MQILHLLQTQKQPGWCRLGFVGNRWSRSGDFQTFFKPSNFLQSKSNIESQYENDRKSCVCRYGGWRWERMCLWYARAITQPPAPSFPCPPPLITWGTTFSPPRYLWSMVLKISGSILNFSSVMIHFRN